MRLTAFVLAAALCAPALAGTASDRIFSTAALELVQVDQQVIYSHTRTGTAGEELKELPDGEIRVTLRTGSDQSREAVVTMGPAGKLRPVSTWPASSGNPILPIFLESTLRTMARTTGGSTFYIRNRIKEALGTSGVMTPVQLTVGGSQVEATEIVFKPFATDKNRERMGDFKDLMLTFVVSAQTPGDIVRFTAATPLANGSVAYLEEITFQKLSSTEE